MFRKIGDKLVCLNPWTHFEVNDPNGDVTMCCDFGRVLGNVKQDSIWSIWNSDSFVNVRKEMLYRGAESLCGNRCPALYGVKSYQSLQFYKDLPLDTDVYQNASLNEQEITEGRVILNSLPRWMRFAFSYHCNLKCYHCYQYNTRMARTRLPTKFLDEMRAHLPYFQIMFHFGGEPFLFKETDKLLIAAMDTNPYCRHFFVTNATVIRDEQFDLLDRTNVGLIAVSLDAALASTYHRLRRGASWGRTMEVLDRLSEMSIQKSFKLTFSMTLSKANYREIEKFFYLAKAKNATPLVTVVGNPKGYTFFKRYLDFSQEEITAILKQIERLSEGNWEIESRGCLRLLWDNMVNYRKENRYFWNWAKNRFRTVVPKPLYDPLRAFYKLIS